MLKFAYHQGQQAALKKYAGLGPRALDLLASTTLGAVRHPYVPLGLIGGAAGGLAGDDDHVLRNTLLGAGAGIAGGGLLKQRAQVGALQRTVKDLEGSNALLRNIFKEQQDTRPLLRSVA